MLRDNVSSSSHMAVRDTYNRAPDRSVNHFGNCANTQLGLFRAAAEGVCADPPVLSPRIVL